MSSIKTADQLRLFMTITAVIAVATAFGVAPTLLAMP